MSSLKDIINQDSDHGDSDPVKREVPGPRPVDSAEFTGPFSSHASPSDASLAPSLPHGQRQSPNPHNRLSPGLGRPQSSSPATSTRGSRRRSNTSVDSMDAYYGYGPGNPGQSSSAPSRGFVPGVPGGENPVKLTPITGRVSRAKKGVPVHTCELCRPPKVRVRSSSTSVAGSGDVQADRL